ncbi:hypothetical protein [Streptomyces sp. NBC_01594]|uniref:hypothetical protein n=1 Tax=Streptomyces sp. NBC_01594 TaxID=2975890 RepID=UPI0038707A57
MGASAYNLYVNLQATTAGPTSGLRSGAGQLRQFDGQLQQVNRSLMETSLATQRLARLQASASVDAVLGQTRVTAAVQRSQAAQNAAATAAERNGRAQVLAANLAARAETERTAAVMAGERALRAQALAQTMAARAQATSTSTASARPTGRWSARDAGSVERSGLGCGARGGFCTGRIGCLHVGCAALRVLALSEEFDLWVGVSSGPSAQARPATSSVTGLRRPV